jgi:hypothetical protein
VIDAVTLEVLKPSQIGRRTLAPKHRAGRASRPRRLLPAGGSGRDHGAQAGEPGDGDELASSSVASAGVIAPDPVVLLHERRNRVGDMAGVVWVDGHYEE